MVRCKNIFKKNICLICKFTYLRVRSLLFSGGDRWTVISASLLCIPALRMDRHVDIPTASPTNAQLKMIE